MEESKPSFPIEEYMIKPMTRAASAGYVPLCSALLWICTRAGTQTEDLGNVALWDKCVAEILPPLSTGEIEILGKVFSSGLSEKIPNYYFSTMKISQPLTEHAFLFSDDPWISSAPFFDQQSWESEFNDKMFVQKSGPATWTHLQVKKAGLA